MADIMSRQKIAYFRKNKTQEAVLLDEKKKREIKQICGNVCSIQSKLTGSFWLLIETPAFVFIFMKIWLIFVKYFKC